MTIIMVLTAGLSTSPLPKNGLSALRRERFSNTAVRVDTTVHAFRLKTYGVTEAFAGANLGSVQTNYNSQCGSILPSLF